MSSIAFLLLSLRLLVIVGISELLRLGVMLRSSILGKKKKLYTAMLGVKCGAKINRIYWAVMAHAFNLSAQEAEASGSLSTGPAWST